MGEVSINIDKGTQVKVYLRNGFLIEGVVDEWREDSVVILSPISGELSVIHSPDQDIYLTKIISSENRIQNNEQLSPDVFIEDDLQTRESHRDHLSRIGELTELHKMRISEEQQRAREKMRTFSPSGNYGTNYGTPTRIQQPVFRDSAEEDK